MRKEEQKGPTQSQASAEQQKPAPYGYSYGQGGRGGYYGRYGYGQYGYQGYSYHYYEGTPAANKALGMRNVRLVLSMAQRHLWSLRWRISLILIVALAALQTSPGFDRTTYKTTASMFLKVENTHGILFTSVGDLVEERIPSKYLDELIRLDMESTFVLGEVLAEMGLGLSFGPRRSRWGYGIWSKFFPNRRNLPSSPPFGGVAHYSWGYANGEGLRFEPSNLTLSFDNPVRLLCNYMGAGLFSIRVLSGERSHPPLVARLGEPVITKQGTLYVDRLHGWPGSEFVLDYQHNTKLTQAWARQLKVAAKGRVGSTGGVYLELSSTRHNSPALMSNIMTRLVEKYNAWRVQFLQERILRSISFYESELEQISRRLEEVEERYRKFLAANSDIVADKTAAGTTDRWVDLERRIYSLNFQLELLGHDISDSHPQAVRIRRELAELEEQRREVQSDLNILPAKRREQAKHLLDITIAENVYSKLHQSLQSARLNLAGVTPPLKLLHNPTSSASSSPVGDKIYSIALLTLSILLGAALYSFATILFSGRILSFAEVEDAGAAVVGTLPHLPMPEAPEKLVEFFRTTVDSAKHSHHVYAREASRAIYSKYHIPGNQMAGGAGEEERGGAPGIVVVHTSATPGVGKSFTSLLMGAYLAKAGKKVLLIDADLRKRRIEPILGEHPDSSWKHQPEHNRGAAAKKPGLTEFLQGKMGLRDVVQTNSLLDMDFITSGAVDETSPWLLTHEPLQAVLQQAKAEYDVVYMDTPPLFAVAESETILQAADIFFLIIRHQVTTARDLRSCMGKFGSLGLAPAGAIFTDVSLGQLHDIYDYNSYAYASYGGYGKASP